MTNAPGLSAFNKVERRMYHLSKELTGIVLPHDTFGTHLRNGKTVDTYLEKTNFKAAGEALADIWNRLEIDKHKVVAEFIENPPSDEAKQFKATPQFKNKHVFETQYMVCYLKCDDRTCCSKFRTSVEVFFPHRRIPALIPIKRSSSGPVSLKLEPEIFKERLDFLSPMERILMEEKLVPEELKAKYGKFVPYDSFLPTCQQKVETRTCKVCFKYHATIKSLKDHRKVCKRPKSNRNPPKKTKFTAFNLIDEIEMNDSENDYEAEDDDSEDDLEAEMNTNSDNEEYQTDLEVMEVESLRPKYSISFPGESVEIIQNLKEWLKSPWQAE